MKGMMLSDAELDSLHKLVCEGLETLHEQSEIGDGGRARILFYAMAGYLEERGIIDHLKGAAVYMLEHHQLRDADLGATTH